MTILHSLTITPLRAAMAGALALAVPAALAIPAVPAAAQSDRLDQVVAALRGITTMKTGFEVKDSNKPEYGTITMIFTRNASAPGGLELTSWVALDAQNKRTTVRLSNQRYGMSVSDSTFTYRDPRRTSRRPR